MAYYTVVDRCPACHNLQKRWVIPNHKKEEVISCIECHINFFEDSNIYQIILTDNVSYSIKTASF